MSTNILKALVGYFRLIARMVSWLGALAIVVLSVVPAQDRPVTGSGPHFEHFAIFSFVAAAFAVGYQLSFIRLAFFAFLFCAGVELLQLPLPTRHARVSDFVIDFAASFLAICVVLAAQKIFKRMR